MLGGSVGIGRGRRFGASVLATALVATTLGACRDVPVPQVRRSVELVASPVGRGFGATVVSPDSTCREGATAVADGAGVHVGSATWDGGLGGAAIDAGGVGFVGDAVGPQVAALGEGRLLLSATRGVATPEGPSEVRQVLHRSEDCGRTWTLHSTIDLRSLSPTACSSPEVVRSRLHVDPFRTVSYLAITCAPGASEGRVFRLEPGATEWQATALAFAAADRVTPDLVTTRSGGVWLATCAGGQALVQRSVDGGATSQRSLVGPSGDCAGTGDVTLSRAANDAVRVAYPSPRAPEEEGGVATTSLRRAFVSFQPDTGGGELTALRDSLIVTADPAASITSAAFVDADDVVSSEPRTRHDSVLSWVEVDRRGRTRTRVAPVIGVFGYGEPIELAATAAGGAAVAATVAAAGAYCDDGATHFVPVWRVGPADEGGSIRAADVTIGRPCGAAATPEAMTTTTPTDGTTAPGEEDQAGEPPAEEAAETPSTLSGVTTVPPPSVPPTFVVPEGLATPTTVTGADPTEEADPATTATTGSTTSTSTSTTTSAPTTTLPPSQLQAIGVNVSDCTVTRDANQRPVEARCPGTATFRFTDGSGATGVNWSVNGTMVHQCQVSEGFGFAQRPFDVPARTTSITRTFTLVFSAKDPNIDPPLSVARVLVGRTVSNDDTFAGGGCPTPG